MSTDDKLSRIRLSDAQVSALECRGLEKPFDEDQDIVADSWPAPYTHLFFARRDADRLARALTEESNAEDAQAEKETCRACAAYARRASASLAALARRVFRASVETEGR